ncbi:hypothetical protein ANN_11388 [Periplaneta americana]|uniref:Uncharacterized protein n=1 Tax=Periplaneta americana TaxID=6978 RepID=A0ABQ8T6N9_PERAM|nr:hypothetical protein ANN_11388 [Periplaneta americana]
MGARKWTLRGSEKKRLEAFKMWIWRRMERLKWTDRVRNAMLERVGEKKKYDAETDQEEEKGIEWVSNRNGYPLSVTEFCSKIAGYPPLRSRDKHAVLLRRGRDGQVDISQTDILSQSTNRFEPHNNTNKASLTKQLGQEIMSFCRKGELLRHNRRHRVLGAIACLLRNKDWEVHEEVHCISEEDSHRRADILEINRQQQKAIIIDPTIPHAERSKPSSSEKKELVVALAEKKLYTEECTGRNGEWEKSSGQKKITGGCTHCILHRTIRNIKSRRLRWAGHVARMDESRKCVGWETGRKIPFWRLRRRWKDNIKMNLREVGYDDRDWINLAQDRDRWRAYVRATMNLRVP